MSAHISDCNRYRYWLFRHNEVEQPTKGAAMFVMLNPSTADAELDDPTIRRCRGFARDWGCAGLMVVNLYALRSTDPAELWRHPDPVGPDNDEHIASLMHAYDDVVCAWGASAKPDRVRQFVKLAEVAGAKLWCLGTTKTGAPRHPLYLRKDAALVRWSQ